MTVADFVKRLGRTRKTPDGWLALCPAHNDKAPSLSIGTGDAGQILLRCFAGCSAEAIVTSLGLRLSDLFPPPPPAPQGACKRASEIPAVEAWLRKTRGLPSSEIAFMWAAETPKGAAVVFPYVGPDGRRLYEKLRAVSTKTFWRRPAGKDSVLYGLAVLADETASERVIVVEGELDVHALRAVGVGPVVSVPDGCGSRLTRELLGPLAPFREVIVATDTDAAGEGLARKLAEALDPERCRRARLAPGKDASDRGHGKNGTGGKDANDALLAGWTAADFERAIDEAQLFGRSPVASAAKASAQAPESSPRSTEDGGDATGDDELDSMSRRYQVIDGRICYLRTDRKGNDIVECLANFEARVEEEITFDDGVETRREFRISGRLATGDALPVARVSAADFAGLGWITRDWGIRAVVSAGNGTKDHLRTAIQHLSTPVARRIFRHTGWADHEGRRVFLYQGGAVGADGIQVDLSPPLDRYRLPAKVEDLRSAVGWSLRFLRCGPLKVTVPLLAAVYLAPVSTVLNPDVSVWLHGRSGSMKSTLSALCLGHFGDFDRKTLSATWTSTGNSLEHRLFCLKDVLSVIDDYAPQPDPRSQKELDRHVQRILRNVGNRASRGRLGADLNQRPDRPPRGFLLCNGEDLPPGLSILARTVVVEVSRRALDTKEISALQANVGRLPHAMRGYVTWLGPQLESGGAALLEARNAIRDRLQRADRHLRLPEAVANLLLGLDLLLQFAEEVGAIDGPAADDVRSTARRVLDENVEEQSTLLGDADPVAYFLRVVGTLMTQKKVCLLDHRSDPGALDIEMIGWRKADRALLIPEAAHRRVAMFARETGGYWNPSRSTLQKDLQAGGILQQANDGRLTHVWKIGIDGKTHRGWEISLELLRGSADDPLPTEAPPSAPSGNTAMESETAELLDDSRMSRSSVTRLPPREGDPQTGARGTRGEG